jgi:hypothetical protein
MRVDDRRRRREKGGKSMDSTWFDRLARSLAHRTTRRGAVRSLAGGALGGAALAGTASRAAAAEDERGVLVLELLAAEMEQVQGGCDALAKAAADFQTRHADLLTAAATPAPGATVAPTPELQDRIQRASARLYVLASACGFAANSTSPFCAAGAGSVTAGEGTPVAEKFTSVQGCHCDDCQCICNDQDEWSADSCAALFFTCLGGSHGSCCWFGICTWRDKCLPLCLNCCHVS